VGVPTVAALFVAKNGCYCGLDDVDAWDERRDARMYTGNLPVVAHPPCARWSQLAGLVEARYGYKRGDDDGCFASALAAVRRHGGVLEHPAYSAAWKHFGLQRPPRKGGWVTADDLGGFTCHVEQGHYGHRARKATWLYAVRCSLPALIWGKSSAFWVSYCGNHNGSRTVVERLSKSQRSATPLKFRDILLAMARSVRH
jgi:hypothetical protein